MAEVKRIATPDEAAAQLKARNIFATLSEAQKNYMFELYEAKTEAGRNKANRDYFANKLYGIMNFLEAGHDSNTADQLEAIIFTYLSNRLKEAQND